MPFGLTHALAVFIDIMNRVCKPHLYKFKFVFINDIITDSQTKEYYVQHLCLILELIRKDKPYVRFFEHELWINKENFLDHAVNSKGIHSEPARMEANTD